MNAWADNPQAAQIDELVGRAARLTSVECDRLVAAWGAAWGAARFAAQDAAWGAAWFEFRDAAWGAARAAVGAAARAAAWGAAQDAAWGAAQDAAQAAAQAAATAAAALAVRDLIDEATPWNRAAYDLLTGPWRRVIGPVHPDDEVLR